MKLPRDMSGEALASQLKIYGYRITRQTGSHIRLKSSLKGTDHYITIPHHQPLKTGTLSNILSEIAVYLEKDKKTIIAEIFR